MQNKFNEILLSILTIIGYENDKEQFVKEYEALNILDAMGKLIPKLPKNVQEKMQACEGDPEKMKQFIPEDDYRRQFVTVSLDAIKELLIAVTPTLNFQQKEKIASFISSQ